MKMWVVEAANKNLVNGGNNWIEIATPRMEAAFDRVKLLSTCPHCAEAPIRTLLYDIEVEGDIYLVEEVKQHHASLPKVLGNSWSWVYKFFSKDDFTDYLDSIERMPLDGEKGAKTDAPDQYCLVQMMPASGFDNPCPGIDMMGLMDHEHVDNFFLKAYDNYKKDKRTGGRVRDLFRADPNQYMNTARKYKFWTERMEKYHQRVDGDGF